MRAVVHYVRGRLSLLAIVEGLVLIQSMILGYELRFLLESPGETNSMPMLHGAVFATIMMLAMTALGLYDSTRDESFRQSVQRIFMAYLLTMLCLSVLFFVLPRAELGRGIFAIASIISIAGLVLIRYIHFRLSNASIQAKKVLVVGDPSDISAIEATIQKNVAGGHTRIAGLLPFDSTTSSQTADAPVSANHSSAAAQHEKTVQQAAQRIRAQGIREIVVACKDQRNGAVPMDLLLSLRVRGTRVSDLLSFYERELGLIKLDHLKKSWLIFGNGFDQATHRAVAKRSFDILASAALLLLAAPLMIVAAIAILLETGRPVFFRQTRSGEMSQPFEVFKFRSMTVDAEKDGTPQWAKKGDNRITRVGNFLRMTRIDELPQIINVLRGDMSFVGPRPERPYFVEQLREQIPLLRHAPPGATWHYRLGTSQGAIRQFG